MHVFRNKKCMNIRAKVFVILYGISVRIVIITPTHILEKVMSFSQILNQALEQGKFKAIISQK